MFSVCEVNDNIRISLELVNNYLMQSIGQCYSNVYINGVTSQDPIKPTHRFMFMKKSTWRSLDMKDGCNQVVRNQWSVICQTVTNHDVSITHQWTLRFIGHRFQHERRIRMSIKWSQPFEMELPWLWGCTKHPWVKLCKYRLVQSQVKLSSLNTWS